MGFSIITNSTATAACIHFSSILWLLQFLLFMKPFITDTHRSSVQGHLCFPPRLIRHAFLPSLSLDLCVSVCVSAWRPKEPLYPCWVLTTLLTPCDDCQVFCPIVRTRADSPLSLQFCFAFLFPPLWILLRSYRIKRRAHALVHAGDTDTNTPLIFTHTTRALSPFAFPTVPSCQALWQAYRAFFSFFFYYSFSLQWQ